MKTLALLFLTTLSLPIAGQSRTDFTKSGNDFLLVCEPAMNTTDDRLQVDRLSCIEWVNGVWAGIQTASKYTAQKPFIAVPSTVVTGQVYRIAVKFMKDHPTELHLHAEDLIMLSLIEAYPPHE